MNINFIPAGVDSTHANMENCIALEKIAGAELRAGPGFSEKQVIYPNQLPAAQEAFTPCDDTIKAAGK